MPGRKQRTNWRDKMPPVFLEMAGFNQECEAKWAETEDKGRRRLAELTADASPEDRQKVVDQNVVESQGFLVWMEQAAAVIGQKFPIVAGNSLAYAYFSFPSERPFPEYLHWERHGESLQSATQRVQTGDVEALQQLHRTEEELFRVAHGKGPIPDFQGDAVHRQLLELIICFEPEDAPLTSEERADCMDAFCACGQPHDADAVRKQYKRLRKQLEAARSAAEGGQPEIK